MTMAGLEVDAVEPAAPQIAGVVVGEIMPLNSIPTLTNCASVRLQVAKGAAPRLSAARPTLALA